MSRRSHLPGTPDRVIRSPLKNAKKKAKGKAKKKGPSLTSAEALEVMRISAKSLVRDGMTKRHLLYTQQARDVLLHASPAQCSKRHWTYRCFLQKALEKTSEGILLSCVLGMGQYRICNMKKNDRTTLIEDMSREMHESPFTNKILRHYAKEAHIAPEGHDHQHQITQRGGDATMKETTGGQAISEGKQLSRETSWPQEICGSNGQDSMNGHGKVFHYNSIPGSAVVETSVCGDLKNIAIQCGEPESWKASITMVFPLWGSVACLMSVHVCSWAVDYFAGKLFGAKVDWVDDGLHIALKDGMTLMVPGPEVTLKGLNDETILHVFGSETLDAINDSPVRKQEMHQGKLSTDCVSMILTSHEAVINLSLGLRRGSDIQKKLNA